MNKNWALNASPLPPSCAPVSVAEHVLISLNRPKHS